MRDKSLSTYAHKVRVIVKELAHLARPGAQRAKVADLARQTAGTEKVNDQMSIEKSRVPRKKKRPDA